MAARRCAAERWPLMDPLSEAWHGTIAPRGIIMHVQQRAAAAHVSHMALLQVPAAELTPLRCAGACGSGAAILVAPVAQGRPVPAA